MSFRNWHYIRKYKINYVKKLMKNIKNIAAILHMRTLKKMSYLDKIFKETLRKYPLVTQLVRKSTSSYTFDGTKINIPENQNIIIPVYAFHRDPDIYPKPDVFDPERFTDELVQTRHSMFYLPFGDGPRNCIANIACYNRSTMGFFEILCGIAAILIFAYYYFTSTFDFWKSRGVRGPQPIPGFGNFKDVMLAKMGLHDNMMKICKDYKYEPMIGVFNVTRPILVVKDPDLIKDILIKDFTAFADRGTPIHEKLDPLSQHLFALEFKRWRPLRTRLSPVFSTGKLKEMFFLISQCADRLDRYIEKLVNKNESIECCELTAKYTTDVIGTCVFGIEINALSDKDNEFRRIGKKMFMPSWKNILQLRLKQSLPWLCDILSYILPQMEIIEFFTRLVVETMKYRDTNNTVRHDFIDTLRELKKHSNKLGDIDLTDHFLAAQAFVFFGAGFENSSVTISNALYEMALNQEIQVKLREEIDKEYKKPSGNFTYENVKKMSYLDKIFHDPDIYPNPDVFDPERFTHELVQTRHSMFYLPFGDGPRNCIGARFAVYQIKIGLIKILQNYKVETCEKTQIPYICDPKAFILSPLDGIYLKMIKIN
ncbi:cytochrome P450 6a2-like isoform X2 [Anoplolepis gracilipes]|uniref:cytochrome P450 6a2-like isoform X2 n=1 Tax=Anoplolepis gracilipes TaxID=354296 RepID=UPI003B9F2B78